MHIQVQSLLLNTCIAFAYVVSIVFGGKQPIEAVSSINYDFPKLLKICS